MDIIWLPKTRSDKLKSNKLGTSRKQVKGTMMLSLIIVTYNNNKTIEETLNSLLLSENENVEIIISDDASTDSTLSIVEKWLKKYSYLFFDSKIIKSKENQGTVKNLARGINASNFQYIKCLAGDDMLLPKAIDKILEFSATIDYDVAFAPIAVLNERAECREERDIISPPTKINNFFQLSHKDQFNKMIFKNKLDAPGAFFTRRFWSILELEKSDLILVEDWYMWMKGIAAEQRFVLFSEPLVIYRKNLQSVSQNLHSNNYKIYIRDICETYKYVLELRPDWINIIDRMKIFFIIQALKLGLSLPLPVIAVIGRIRKLIFHL